jgi:iron complex transport system ATP-binding protein
MAASAPPPAPVLRFQGVDLYRGTTPVLLGVDWQVLAGQRWAVLGPNGCGKTTLVQLASGYLHPTRGTVDVLGRRLGRTDVRALREHVAVVSASIARMVLPRLLAREVVVSARHGALEPWWHTYTAAEQDRALSLLGAAGFAGVAERPFGQLSEGERQQVLLARALMAEPGLVLLDEPCAGLDMGGRERLLARVAELAADPAAPPMVLVTHHVEEVPHGFTHALVLKAGRALASAPVTEALTGPLLSECFDIALEVGRSDGRWWSRARRAALAP